MTPTPAPGGASSAVSEIGLRVDEIVGEVASRFRDWEPSPAQLGFARACVNHALTHPKPSILATAQGDAVREATAGEKIIAGLEDALAYQQGDTSRGRAHHVRAARQPHADAEVVEVLREVSDAANDMIVALNDRVTPILTPERYNSAGERVQAARNRIDALLAKLEARHEG